MFYLIPNLSYFRKNVNLVLAHGIHTLYLTKSLVERVWLTDTLTNDNGKRSKHYDYVIPLHNCLDTHVIYLKKRVWF